MTSHELARKLLELPDAPVILPYSDDDSEVTDIHVQNHPGYPTEIHLI
jgi:hypothetical protein